MATFTICHTYYNQLKMLAVHLEAWSQHPSGLAKYAIIDDCSSASPIAMLNGSDVRLYRIEDDIPWNIAGARNLALHVAETDWVLCADMDHVVSAEAVRSISQMSLKDDTVYTFRRRRSDGQYGCSAIVNVLIKRTRYFDVGGHDEDFSGHYGREETFFHHSLGHAGLRIEECAHIVLDWLPQLGGTYGLRRDKTQNASLYQAKMLALRRDEYRNGPLLRFRWSRTN